MILALGLSLLILALGGCAGFVLWLLFAAFDWQTTTAAFTAGVVGMYLAELAIGAMVQRSERGR